MYDQCFKTSHCVVNILILSCSYAALVDRALNAETFKWKFSLDLIQLCMIQRIFTMLRIWNKSDALGLETAVL